MAATDHQPNEQKPEPLLLVRGKRPGLGALRRELIPPTSAGAATPRQCVDTTAPVTAPGASSPSAIQAAMWNSALTANCQC
jgi:hypothetical protein